MRLLLVYPPVDKSLPSILPEQVEASRGAFPPLGILYLAGELKKEPGIELSVIDAPNQNLSNQQIARIVEEKEIELVGMTVLSFHLLDALELAEKIKERAPRVKIIVGGPHPHIYPKETLELGVFDYLVRGEGEEVFCQFVNNLKAGKPEPAGIISAQNPDQIDNRASIEDLDRLEFPARQMLPIELYHSVLSPRRPITTAISSRGCPYQCIFCDRPHLGKKFRARSAKNVVEEMEKCLELGIKEVVFYDDNFTTIRERVLEIAELILERKLKISWDIRARVGDLKKEDYLLLKKAGLERIHFGVESGDERLLEIIRKGITLEEARSAFLWARQAGIETLAYFMLGLPGESRETISKTISFAKELKPDYVHFSLLMLFPATPVYQMALERGIIEKDLWGEFARNPTPDFQPPIWEENLKREELVKALHTAYKKFYLRGSYLFQRLIRTRSFSGLLHQAKMAGAIFGLGK